MGAQMIRAADISMVAIGVSKEVVKSELEGVHHKAASGIVRVDCEQLYWAPSGIKDLLAVKLAKASTRLSSV